MKPTILYLVVLAGGAAAGAGVVGTVNVVRGARSPTDELASETLLHREEPLEPPAHGGGPEERREPFDSAEATFPGSHVVPDAEPGATPMEMSAADPVSPRAVGTVVDSVAVADTYRRLSRIFAAMKPNDAAEVLSQLEDAQIESILRFMQERSAAPILAIMDPERVASVSRHALGAHR